MVAQIKELNALSEYEKAAALAAKAVEKEPNSALIYTWWGKSLANQGKTKEALEKFIRSTQIDPNQAKTYIYWGLTLALQNKHEEAIDKYENALLLEPQNSSAYASWGASLNNLKKYDEAIKKLEEALEFNPKNRIAYGVLVDSYFHKGEYTNAWSAVKRARKEKIKVSAASLKRLADASPEPK